MWDGGSWNGLLVETRTDADPDLGCSEGRPELPVVLFIFIHQLNPCPSSLSKQLEVCLTRNRITHGGVEPWLRITALTCLIHRECDLTFCSVPTTALPCRQRE